MSDLEFELMTYLLPLYIDGKTSPETNAYVEEHLQESDELREMYSAMTADMTLASTSSVRKHGLGPVGKLAVIVGGYVLLIFIIVVIAGFILSYGAL